jgi:hypothetical protein
MRLNITVRNIRPEKPSGRDAMKVAQYEVLG